MIHHVFEEIDEICKRSAVQKLKPVCERISSITNAIPREQTHLESILNEASYDAWSLGMIRELSYSFKLSDGSHNVGKAEDLAYNCHLLMTVERIKVKLVKGILNKVSQRFANAICKGILAHMRSRFWTTLNVQSDDIAFEVSKAISDHFLVVFKEDRMSYYRRNIDTLSSARLAAVSSVVTFLRPLNVNSTHWRRIVADEIYDTLCTRREPLLLKMLPKIRDMCQKTKDDLQSIIAWNGKLQLHNQQECMCKK